MRNNRVLACDHAPSAIFVMSGDIVKRNRQGKDTWRSTSYKDCDLHSGLGGGHARVIAALELANSFPDAIIVPMSRTRLDQPTHATVIEQELLRLGLCKERIWKEKETDSMSTSTHSTLREIVKMTVNHNWRCTVTVTSDYHLERCYGMLSRLDALKGCSDDPEFLVRWKEFLKRDFRHQIFAAEPILIARNNIYSRIIDAVHRSASYANRVEMERKGIEALLKGNYNFQQLKPLL